jgi:hypothetical protein
MNEAGNGGVAFFCQRVGLPGIVVCLARVGQALPEDRIVSSCRFREAEVVGCNEKGIACVSTFQGIEVSVFEFEGVA